MLIMEVMKNDRNVMALLTKGLEGKWVAMTLDHKKVIDSSADLATLEGRIADNKKVVYMKVMSSDREFAF
ncbi:MAG: hypothetical protein RLZZ26_390 [Candidatus Parcubacteria bacterium]|jgi:hypothetical protein